MEAEKVQDLLIGLLRAELTGTELDDAAKEQITPDALSALYALSDRQDLAHMVSAALSKNGLLADQKLAAQFAQKEILSVYRAEQMKAVFDKICTAFDQASIAYVPLKGLVMRPFYPKESMRTSCDMDILIREENLDAAVDALTQIGFRYDRKNYHDVSLYYGDRIHLELHFSILGNKDRLDAVMKDAWQYVTPVQGCRCAFTEDYFVFYMFAHMVTHFRSGGCGIRSLMDIWVMEHKMGLSYLRGKALLEKAGIYRFAREISKLSEICFSDKPKDDFTDILLSYLFRGGMYGSLQNRVAVTKSKSGSMLVYVLKRVFLPYGEMVVPYPILKKLPVLLPFCWIARFAKMLLEGRAGRAVNELKTGKNLTDTEVNTLHDMFSRLGL